MTVANALDPTAAQETVKILLDLYERRVEGDAGEQSKILHLQLAARSLASRARRALRATSTLEAYMNQKFPGLTIEEVRSVLARLSEMRGMMRCGFDVRPHPRLPSCYLVTSRQA